MVDINGGTLSQNVTLNVLGSGMTDYELDSALTISAGANLTLNTGTRFYVNQGVAVTVNGSLAINNAAWVQQHCYNGDQTGFVVNSGGVMTVANTTFSGVSDGNGGGNAYVTVNNGASLTASGCTFSLQAESLNAGSTLSLTNNTFGGALYCPVTYVSQLTSNTSFGVVDINGGTLSQNVTLNVLGSGMTDYELDSALTISAGANLTLNTGTRFYVNQGVAVTVNGSLAINNAAWVQQHCYNGDQTGFVVNSGGVMTVANTTFSGVSDGNGGGNAYVTVNNGASLTASGCTFSLQAESLNAGSTLSLTNNAFGGTLYCPLTYVSELANNVSFGVVDINGGTLSQNVTLNVLGSGMTDYELDSALTISAGANLTLNTGTRFYVNQGVAVTVNGSLAINNAAWVQQHCYNGDQTGFVVNSGGVMTVANTTFSGVSDGNGGGNAYVTVNNGASLTASGCTFNLQSVTIAGGVFAEGETFNTQVTLGAGSHGTVKYDTFTYNGDNYFYGGMTALVTDNDFSASKAESQGGGGPVNLSGNYWGATTDATIRSQHIYDNANNSSLPVINIDPFLTAGPVFSEHLAFSAQPSSAVAGGTITPPVQVSVEDPDGVVILTDSSNVKVAIWANPGNGTLLGTLTQAAVKGVATFGNLSISNAGTGYTLMASDGSYAGATSSSFSITPGNPIPVSVATSQTSGTYGTSTTIPITVTFSHAVLVTGTPELTLDNGATANYQSGSGTSALIFSFTVAAGQNTADLDYTSTNALSLNGGTIMDSGSLPAYLTLPATGADGLATAHVVIRTGTVMWNNLSGGDWDTPANWLGSVLPGANDVVMIPALTSGSVTHGSSAADTVASITSSANIVLAAGGLTVTGNFQETSAAITLQGGTLADATLAGTSTLTLTSGGGTLNAVTIGPNATFDGTYAPTNGYIATANILNGMTLNGSANLGSASGSSAAQLFFIQPGTTAPATETLTGSGTVTFGASTNNEMLSKGNNAAAPVTLVIDDNVTIQGGSGTLGSYYGNDSFINNGSIFGNWNGAGGALTIGGNSKTNSGPNHWTNNALIDGGGGTLNLSGSFTDASLAEFTDSGGTVNVVGSLANTSLFLSPGLGNWDLAGGTITGGTISTMGGSNLALTSGAAALNSSISGPGGLTKTGAGTVTLSGQNNYTGGTSVLSGTLVLAKPSSLATGSSLIVGASASSILAASQSASASLLTPTVSAAGDTTTNPAAPVASPAAPATSALVNATIISTPRRSHAVAASQMAAASPPEPCWAAIASVCNRKISAAGVGPSLAARDQFFSNYGR